MRPRRGRRPVVAPAAGRGPRGGRPHDRSRLGSISAGGVRLMGRGKRVLGPSPPPAPQPADHRDDVLMTAAASASFVRDQGGTVTGRGALAGEGASGLVSLAGGTGHDPPAWSPAASGDAVGHRVVTRPLPLPAPSARPARVRE